MPFLFSQRIQLLSRDHCFRDFQKQEKVRANHENPEDIRNLELNFHNRSIVKKNSKQLIILNEYDHMHIPFHEYESLYDYGARLNMPLIQAPKYINEGEEKIRYN